MCLMLRKRERAVGRHFAHIEACAAVGRQTIKEVNAHTTATVMGGLINLTWGLSVRLWLGCGLRLARVQCKEGR